MLENNSKQQSDKSTAEITRDKHLLVTVALFTQPSRLLI